MKRTHSMRHGKPDAGELARPVWSGGGEETPGRKAGTGASPPTLR